MLACADFGVLLAPFGRVRASKSAALLAAPGVLDPTAFLPFKHTAFTCLVGPPGFQIQAKNDPCWDHVGTMLAHFSLLGASWPLFSRLVAFCCRSWPLLVRPGALRARFLRVWGRSREALRPTRRCFLRFYAVCALALSQCSECNKTTILMGRNTLRKHCAPRPKSQKIAGRAFRNQQPT